MSLDGLVGGLHGTADGGVGTLVDASGDDGVAESGGGGGGGGGGNAGDASTGASNGPSAAGDGPISIIDTGPGSGPGGGFDAAQLPPYRIVFVSSQLYGGNLGGISGADAKCQSLAGKAGLAGTFFAWISDGTVTPASRMTHENLPYVLADGHTQVAADWNALASGTLDFPIEMTEQKTTVTPVPSCGPQGYVGNFVWTDTSNAAVEWNAGDECASWGSGSNGATGSTGNASSTTYWTQWCLGVPCDTQAAIYCVQQ